jgi:prenyltransferase beta subunit
LDLEIKDEGFSNSQEEEDKISYEATAYALEILEYYDKLETRDFFGEVEHTVNTSDLQEYLEDKAKDRIKSGNVDIYKLYYILKSLDILDYDTSSSLEADVEAYLDASEQNGNGFAPTDTSSLASISSTYFAMMIYELIDESIPNESSHKYWIKSCRNGDGGYGGNTTLTSSVFNTYCAIIIFEEIYDVDDLSSQSATIDYLKSFYVEDENDEDNYGGYLPDANSENALLSSTYYCIKGISIIDSDELEDEDDTLNWILNRQNFKDGGFIDNSEGYEQKKSSVTCSYFAYETLKIIDGIELPILEEKVFMLEFIWIDWLILIIILSVIGAAVITGIVIWRKRRI